jgi:hypothetical protein
MVEQAVLREEGKQHAPGAHPDMPPPVTERGAIKWMRENLFSSTTNIVLTLLGVLLVYLIVPPLLDWAVFHSVFDAGSRIGRFDLAEKFRSLRLRRTTGGESDAHGERDEFQLSHIRKDSVLRYDPSIS